MSFNKYSAKRTHCGKHSHMSLSESACCLYLQLLERAGELKIIKSQPNVIIPEACCRIIPDWLICYRDGREAYADYKGFEKSTSWRRNRRLWKMYGPLPMEVWKQKSGRFFISEVIQGKGGQNGSEKENQEARKEKEEVKD